jgi:hypothetical protein
MGTKTRITRSSLVDGSYQHRLQKVCCVSVV